MDMDRGFRGYPEYVGLHSDLLGRAPTADEELAAMIFQDLTHTSMGIAQWAEHLPDDRTLERALDLVHEMYYRADVDDEEKTDNWTKVENSLRPLLTFITCARAVTEGYRSEQLDQEIEEFFDGPEA